jgi:hypothetical protein
VPAEVRLVIICADNDVAGLDAARALARRLLSEQRRVKILTPDTPGTDWADLQEVGHGLRGMAYGQAVDLANSQWQAGIVLDKQEAQKPEQPQVEWYAAPPTPGTIMNWPDAAVVWTGDIPTQNAEEVPAWQ